MADDESLVRQLRGLKAAEVKQIHPRESTIEDQQQNPPNENRRHESPDPNPSSSISPIDWIDLVEKSGSLIRYVASRPAIVFILAAAATFLFYQVNIKQKNHATSAPASHANLSKENLLAVGAEYQTKFKVDLLTMTNAAYNDGTPIPRSQPLVVDQLYKLPDNLELLIRTTYERRWEGETHRENEGKAKSKSPIHMCKLRAIGAYMPYEQGLQELVTTDFVTQKTQGWQFDSEDRTYQATITIIPEGSNIQKPEVNVSLKRVR